MSKVLLTNLFWVLYRDDVSKDHVRYNQVWLKPFNPFDDLQRGYTLIEVRNMQRFKCDDENVYYHSEARFVTSNFDLTSMGLDLDTAQNNPQDTLAFCIEKGVWSPYRRQYGTKKVRKFFKSELETFWTCKHYLPPFYTLGSAGDWMPYPFYGIAGCYARWKDQEHECHDVLGRKGDLTLAEPQGQITLLE